MAELMRRCVTDDIRRVRGHPPATPAGHALPICTAGNVATQARVVGRSIVLSLFVWPKDANSDRNRMPTGG